MSREAQDLTRFPGEPIGYLETSLSERRTACYLNRLILFRIIK